MKYKSGKSQRKAIITITLTTRIRKRASNATGDKAKRRMLSLRWIVVRVKTGQSPDFGLVAQPVCDVIVGSVREWSGHFDTVDDRFVDRGFSSWSEFIDVDSVSVGSALLRLVQFSSLDIKASQSARSIDPGVDANPTFQDCGNATELRRMPANHSFARRMWLLETRQSCPSQPF